MTNSVSRQIILSVLAIALLFIALIGISYAIYSSTLRGIKENTISTGTISILYRDLIDEIIISPTTRIDDENGKLLINNENVFDFVVNSDVSAFTDLYYEIVVSSVDLGENFNKDIKFFLLKKDVIDFLETDITREPQKFQNNMFLSEIYPNADGMLLYKGNFHNEQGFTKKMSEDFRLKIWLSDSASADNIGKNFIFKLNVYAKVKH